MTSAPTDETEIDDFGWLPAALRDRGLGDAPPVERVGVSTSAGHVSGLRWGTDAPRLVLLHGGGQNAHTWDLVAALLDVPLLAVDLPGHGRSDWREDRDYAPMTTARTLGEALDRFGVRPDAVVGMSLGGLATIAMLGRRPDLVPRAAVVDILPGAATAARRLPRAEQGQVALLDGPRDFASIDEMLAATAAAAPNRSLTDLRRGVVHNAVRTPEGRYRWRYDDVRDLELEEERLWAALGGSTAPVLLIRGGDSRFTTEESVGRLASIRPDARIETVEGAGHAVQSTHPDALAALLSGFLPSVSGR